MKSNFLEIQNATFTASKLNKVNNQHKVSLIDLIKRILKND